MATTLWSQQILREVMFLGQKLLDPLPAFQPGLRPVVDKLGMTACFLNSGSSGDVWGMALAHSPTHPASHLKERQP